MSKEDILQEIPDDKLPELKKVFRQNWPLAIYVYYLVETTIQIKKKFPKSNYVKIYCPDGDFSDGTIVAIYEMHCYDVFIFTLDKKLIRLEQVLRETKLINYSKNPLFSAVHEDIREMAFRVGNEIGQPFLNDVPSHVWWIPRENALKYDIKMPEDLTIVQLNETHANIMNAVWPHRSPGSEKYLAKLIELNGGVGLLCKKTNELCAWVLKNYFGGLGILQVAENHKRKGYGSLIAKIFSKKLAEDDGFDVTGFIVRSNSASQNMFTKLGFEKIIPVTWMELTLHFCD